MTTRILPRDEWHRLEGTEAERVWPHLDADRTQIIVLEEGDRIVGCQVLMTVLHAECLWVHPSYRRASVSRQLWQAVQQAARAIGVQSLMTAACDRRVERLLAYVGAHQLPGRHYVVPVKGEI